MNESQHPLQIGGKKILFSFPNWAEQTNGNVLVQIGDTVVLITATMAKSEPAHQDFFPLTVEYEERFYAAGKILGSRFVRREGRPSDEAVITARLIDRAIRPLFPKEFFREVQVIATCVSWDAENDSDIVGLLGASVALSISNIPWNGPVGAVRVGRVENAFVLNPTYEEREKSDLDFIIAGVKQGGDVLFNMIEAESNEISEETYEQALEFAKPLILEQISFQEELQKKIGKEKFVPAAPTKDEELEQTIRTFLGDKLEKALLQENKQERMASVDQVRTELFAFLQEQFPDEKGKIGYAAKFFDGEMDEVVHKIALEKDQRVDGRGLDEVRPLTAAAGILPRTHGSGLFTRGQTRSLSLLTLGGPGDHKIIDGMEMRGKKRFMHHYNFPPYAPGEVKPLRGPGRREIGHGMLAEKALLPSIPNFEDFPYTIRIVTEILSSNGSTSMASVCSSTLALMDAGVPIKRPVTGISVGLMSDDKGNYRLLTDIQGPEDHHGDMDFKVAGTEEGITAIQLDVKVQGITSQIFKETLARAKAARHRILEEVIQEALPAPREQLSEWAPKIFSTAIDPSKIGLIIGPGGKTINKMIDEYGVEIDIDDSGEIFITAEDARQGENALLAIKNLTHEIKPGELYEGTVKRIMDFGAFVEVLPGQEGLVHISQLAPYRVDKVTDIVNVGDVIPVKVIEIDGQGRINLSLKAAREETQESKTNASS